MNFFEMEDPFALLTIESFWKKYTLHEYFVLPPPNYLVGGYVKNIWYV